jgi:hypothetical protein
VPPQNHTQEECRICDSTSYGKGYPKKESLERKAILGICTATPKIKDPPSTTWPLLERWAAKSQIETEVRGLKYNSELN